MKFEPNWRYKSIDSLEKTNPGPVPTDESSIVQRLWKLRKVPINEFKIDDIRFMIIQGIGLKYLLVEAVEVLRENILAEGNYYEGDLLNSILQLDKKQWKEHRECWNSINELIKDKIDALKTIRPALYIKNFYDSRPE